MVPISWQWVISILDKTAEQIKQPDIPAVLIFAKFLGFVFAADLEQDP